MNARVWVRIREVELSLNLVEQIVRRMPAGPVKVEAGGEDRNAEGMNSCRRVPRRSAGVAQNR